MLFQIECLTSQLNALKDENGDLLSHNEIILQQIAEAEANLIEQVSLSSSLCTVRQYSLLHCFFRKHKVS